MPTSGFFAVLRDVTKLSAAAADDVASLVGKAASKTAGLAVDDVAVGAAQVGVGIDSSQELDVLWRVTKGSLINKAVLTVGVVLVSLYASWLLTTALVLGALYLAYEAVEEVWRLILESNRNIAKAPEMSVDDKVKGAIRTDFILSLEILVLAMAALEGDELGFQIVALVFVGILMTAVVYGLVAFLVRLDDMALMLMGSGQAWKRVVGGGILRVVPYVLRMLKPLGVGAMLLVSGGVLTHLVDLPFVADIPGIVWDAFVGVAVGLAGVGVMSGARKAKAMLTRLR